jgi:hypothetical protein
VRPPPPPDRYRGQRSTPHALPHVTKHARDRMIEYFGRDLTPDEWASVIARLKAGVATCVSLSERDGYGVFAVEAAPGFTVRFTWRLEVLEVVTVLPPTGSNHKAVERYRHRGVKRKGNQQAAKWRDGVRYPARIRWDAETDAGRGPREAALDTAEDDA